MEIVKSAKHASQRLSVRTDGREVRRIAIAAEQYPMLQAENIEIVPLDELSVDGRTVYGITSRHVNKNLLKAIEEGECNYEVPSTPRTFYAPALVTVTRSGDELVESVKYEKARFPTT